MRVSSLTIPDLLVLTPTIFSDPRGFFFESFNEKTFQTVTGLSVHFVQDNHSYSRFGTLRGLHYQLPPKAQGKLVRVTEGIVFDVAVDIRKNSPTLGQWAGIELSADNHLQLWIPPGFAHGFVVLSESAQLLYKTTDFYSPELECCIQWNDPDLTISWPIEPAHVTTSPRDAKGDSWKKTNFFSDTVNITSTRL